MWISLPMSNYFAILRKDNIVLINLLFFFAFINAVILYKLSNWNESKISTDTWILNSEIFVDKYLFFRTGCVLWDKESRRICRPPLATEGQDRTWVWRKWWGCCRILPLSGKLLLWQLLYTRFRTLWLCLEAKYGGTFVSIKYHKSCCTSQTGSWATI